MSGFRELRRPIVSLELATYRFAEKHSNASVSLSCRATQMNRQSFPRCDSQCQFATVRFLKATPRCHWTEPRRDVIAVSHNHRYIIERNEATCNGSHEMIAQISYGRAVTKRTNYWLHSNEINCYAIVFLRTFFVSWICVFLDAQQPSKTPFKWSESKVVGRKTWKINNQRHTGRRAAR